ncbi:uncharacterized protein SCHCODRAFT_01158360 [Schizophyllum commune H4-8]|nr:uncharacterized protein SCHCODRAFT_01158360 [Schizophyllum commune H4-8]KAI5889679.1 hypothetical protein SCHCODRAFT_01158360 [Schizophyllum commune H4-8]
MIYATRIQFLPLRARHRKGHARRIRDCSSEDYLREDYSRRDRREKLPVVTRSRVSLAELLKKLPQELLEQVFICCNDEGLPQSTLLPAHVCRTWRSIAFNERRMWTKLSVTDDQSCGAGSIEQLRAWFQRASPLLVAVTVAVPAEDQDQDRLDHFLLDHRTQPLTGQIRALDITAANERWERLAALPTDAFRSLEKLQLKGDVVSASLLPLGTPLSSLSYTPHLRTFAVEGLVDMVMSRMDTIFPIRWSRLEHLCLAGVQNMHGFPDVFRQCTSLKTASITTWDSENDNSSASRDAVPLPHLTTLEIMFWEWPVKCMSAVSLPALKHLSLTDTRSMGFNSWGDLVALADRAAGLEELLIDGLDMKNHESDFETLLTRLPRLRVLELSSIAMRPEHLLPIFYRASSSSQAELVPELRRLYPQGTRLLQLQHNRTYSPEVYNTYARAYGLIRKLLEHRLQSPHFRDCTLTCTYPFYVEKVPLDICQSDVVALGNLITKWRARAQLHVDGMWQMEKRIFGNVVIMGW